jgi:hypothetical protein
MQLLVWTPAQTCTPAQLTECASAASPLPQMMHVTVYDVGSLSPGAMLSSLADPFADSSSWRSRQLMGRTALPVAQACGQPGVAVQAWHRLTKGDWSCTGVELAALSAGGWWWCRDQSGLS